ASATLSRSMPPRSAARAISSSSTKRKPRRSATRRPISSPPAPEACEIQTTARGTCAARYEPRSHESRRAECDRCRRRRLDCVAERLGDEDERSHCAHPDQLLVLARERERVHHDVELFGMDGLQPRVQKQLAKGSSRKAGLLDQPLDGRAIGLMRLELEKAEN